MDTQTATPTAPEGFTDVKGVPTPGAVVERGDVSKGIVARYLGYKPIAREGQRPSRLHVFQLPQAHGGKRFSLWGTTRLDNKLAAVRTDSIIYLRYLGKVEVEGQEQGAHEWEVSSSNKKPSAELLSSFEPTHNELAGRIAEAEAEGRARASGNAPAATSAGFARAAADDDDDDLPF